MLKEIASLALLFVAGACATQKPAARPAADGKRPTEPFRAEHVEIKEHLGHLHTMVGDLSGAAPDKQRDTMKFVVKFLHEHIRAHAEWEEKVLYPVVDRYAGGGAHAFTASMRYEHRIVGRWIDELGAESEKAEPDPVAFARRADNLLGLIGAHFEEEEEVLLPLLDAKMTPEQFEREVAQKGTHH